MSQGKDSFIVLSINHEQAPLEIRERYSVDDTKIDSLYGKLRSELAVPESLILNTCNRFEIYTKLDKETTPQSLIDFIANFYQEDAEQLLKHIHLHSGERAIQHLIEVSAGLRSQITGEVEIFGQVKNAYAQSQNLGYAGKVINRVFQKGFQAAKLIRNTTAIGEGQINISNVAVELASKIFGNLEVAGTLSLGTGEIGEKTMKALRSRGAKRMGIASRSQDRAEAVAALWGGTPHAMQNLPNFLPDYDIVIASTVADEPVITRSLIEKASSKRRDRPFFLIDLGLPRNIEKRCEELDNVFLYNLDDLASIAEENLASRKEAVSECENIAAAKAQFIWENLVKRGLAK